MKKNYFLDTNILVENPQSIRKLINGNENHIWIPYSVFAELNSLKKKSNVSYIIPEILDEIEKNSEFCKILPRLDELYSLTGVEIIDVIDNFILKEILSSDIEDKIFVTNDKWLRIQAQQVYNIKSQEFKDSNPFKSEAQKYTGFVDFEGGETLEMNCFYWKEGKLHYNQQGKEKPIDYDNTLWKLSPKTPYQNAVMELLLDDKLDLVTISSDAGYGKSTVAMAAALHLVLEKKKFKKIFIFKANVEIGHELGFLPGSAQEKMENYFRPNIDILNDLHELRPAKRLYVDDKCYPPKLDQKRIEMLPINFLRGANINNSVVILEEAQNFSRIEMRTILSRMGENVKCIIIGDPRQIDNQHLNIQNNGLNWVVSKFRKLTNYGHIVLSGAKSRGIIADMVRNSGL